MEQHGGARSDGVFSVAGSKLAATFEGVLEQGKLGGASSASVPIIARVACLGAADTAQHRAKRNGAFREEYVVFAEGREVFQREHKKIEISTS